MTRLLRLRGSYARQRAENRSPFSFERGNLLPNAPQHRLQARLTMAAADIQSHYVVSHGSRHFLDRANQRPVPVRTVHGAGLRARLSSSLTTAFEIRNLTDDQVADLWGYPLPGRSWFLSFEYDLSLSPAP